MDRSSSGTKIRGNRANGQFLDLGYLSAPKGPNRNIIIIRLSRLVWTQVQITKVVAVNEQRISQIIDNTISGKIGNFLCQERDKVSFFQTGLTS